MTAARSRLPKASASRASALENRQWYMLQAKQAQQLFEHLKREIPDAHYVTFMVEEIDDACNEYKKVSHLKGTKKPQPLDPEIQDIQDCLNAHHTGGTPLSDAAYKQLFSSLGYLLEVRDRTRARGRPRNEARDLLIWRISNLYPDEFSRTNQDGHFAQTVRLVAGFVRELFPGMSRNNKADLRGMLEDVFCGCNPRMSEIIRATWQARPEI